MEQKIKDNTEAELGFGIRLLAGATALLVALAVPVFYFTLGYSTQVSSLETEIEITAKTAERLLKETNTDDSPAQSYLNNPGLIMLLHERPDSGEDEMALSSKSGVTRYPAFLVSIPAFKTDPERVHPFAKEKDMSVDDFLLAIKGRIAHIFSKKAFASFESKAYEAALKYYKLALDYDPKSFYAYFAMGMVHEKIGVEKESIESLLDAETTFLKALEIDPNHKDTKAALENIRKNIAILRER